MNKFLVAFMLAVGLFISPQTASAQNYTVVPVCGNENLPVGAYSGVPTMDVTGFACITGTVAGGGGGPATIADGADVTLGAKLDSAWSGSGAGSVDAILKAIYNSSIGSIPAGTNNIGTVGIAASTTGGGTPYHFISTASTNSTLISTGPHTLLSLTLHGLNTTVGYVRIYDTAAAPTCSSATGASHTYAIIGSATQIGGLVVPLPAQGEGYANGLAYCVTGGSADTDNTSGPAGIIINATYK